MYRITNTEFLKSNSKIIAFSNNHLPRGNHFFEATKKIFHRGLPQMMNLMARVAKFPSGRGRFRGSRLTNPQIRPSISILLSAVSGSAIGIVDRDRGDGVVDIHFLGRKIAKRRFQLSFPSGTYLFGRLFGLFSCYFFFFFFPFLPPRRFCFLDETIWLRNDPRIRWRWWNDSFFCFVLYFFLFLTAWREKR